MLTQCSIGDEAFVGVPLVSGSVRNSSPLLTRNRGCRVRLRRPRVPIRASSSESIPTRPDELNDAVRSARQGRFQEAARRLRGSVPPSLVAAPAERRRLACDLLNPVTLARVAESSRNGGTELFDNGVRDLYESMAATGLLPALGAERDSSVSKMGTVVTVDELVNSTGLAYSSLSPKRGNMLLWQIAGIAAVSLTMSASRAVGAANVGGPLIASLALFLAVDQTLLRGSVLETAFSAINPKFKDRIVHHEAAHFIVAYLCGLQISGYVTSGREALLSGIPSLGQGGTIFSFPELSDALQAGSLKARTIDIWSVVLMAGIAAEALKFGQAEGGASDEETLIGLLQQLGWDPNRVKAQARFGVLQAVRLLRTHNDAYVALVKKMKANAPLGDCIDCIEQNILPSGFVASTDMDGSSSSGAPRGISSTESTVSSADAVAAVEEEAVRIARREAEVLKQLADIKAKLSDHDKQ